MAEKKAYINKLKNKYRLIVYNDTTFEEVRSFKVNRLNMFSLIGSVVVLLVALVIVLIAFTPLREFIPGYPDGEMQKNIVQNAIRTDSLQYEIELRDQYFNNIKTIIEGDAPVNYINSQDTNVDVGKIEFSKSKEDSLLRLKIENEQRFNISMFNQEQKAKEVFKVHFYPPVQGIITSHFDLSKNHYGTDLVASQDAVIHSTLDGTVILSSWTLETGFIIQVQHANDFVSIYKHIDQKLVDVGTAVKAGDPIAIVGNSGELSTGTHLHFELWHKGTPVNAEEYIVF